jgi:hypothetical protein
MTLTRSTLANIAAQLVLGIAALFVGELVCAQTAPSTVAKPVPSLPGRPLWMDLTEAQQQALAPLTQQWPTMSEPHKRKWLAISQNFAQLSTDEQNTVQRRMQDWASLTPQQRTAARLNYADAQQLLQEDKKAKWEAYQALSPEAKQKLATQQTPPPVGAAPAVKPVAAKKLTPAPAASSNKALPRIATDQAAPTTLLPNNVTISTTPVNAPSEGSASPQ